MNIPVAMTHDLLDLKFEASVRRMKHKRPFYVGQVSDFRLEPSGRISEVRLVHFLEFTFRGQFCAFQFKGQLYNALSVPLKDSDHDAVFIVTRHLGSGQHYMDASLWSLAHERLGHVRKQILRIQVPALNWAVPVADCSGFASIGIDETTVNDPQRTLPEPISSLGRLNKPFSFALVHRAAGKPLAVAYVGDVRPEGVTCAEVSEKKENLV